MNIYDPEWVANYERNANAAIPGRSGLYKLCQVALSSITPGSHILVVGCGTGTELISLINTLPSCSFVAIEPEINMLEICRKRIEDTGVSHKVAFQACRFDEWKLSRNFSAATSILVSQHITDQVEAGDFFKKIADSLLPGGIIFTADMHIPNGVNREMMINLWQKQALFSGIKPESVSELSKKFQVELALRNEHEIINFLHDAEFKNLVKPFSSLLYGAWIGYRSEKSIA